MSKCPRLENLNYSSLKDFYDLRDMHFRIKVQIIEVIGRIMSVKISTEDTKIINKIFSDAKIDKVINEIIKPDTTLSCIGLVDFPLDILEGQNLDLCMYTDFRGLFGTYICTDWLYPYLRNSNEENKKLKEENKKINEENFSLKTQIEYAPDGPGYFETKEHFQKLLSQ